MDEHTNHSEVACLLQQISLEFEAARLGLTGLAFGTAQHTFINAKMERAAIYQEQLAEVVGEQQATRLMVEQYVKVIG